jgi:hypothetical protein
MWDFTLSTPAWPSRPGAWALALALALPLSFVARDLSAQAPTTRDDSKARENREALEKLQESVKKEGRVAKKAQNPAFAGLTVPPPKDSVGLIPLNDLGKGTYEGKEGGLYPGGRNERPAAHEAAGLRIARTVRPLDAQGKPDDDGKIVLLSIGMSNTTNEFSTFQPMADKDPQKNPRLVIVDGAQGGMTAGTIINLEGPRGQQFWNVVASRLQSAGVTPEQVQVAWIKEADAGPRGPFPDYAVKLEDELIRVAQILEEKFPNIKLAYNSSRIYGGYATTPLNPEPYAYHSGFSVKWMIEKQIEGDPALNYDPARGPVKAPWLAWGPYLWADGVKPRSDGLTYVRSDLAADGTHPAPNGAREKVARLLLDFFKSDSTARPWFVR